MLPRFVLTLAVTVVGVLATGTPEPAYAQGSYGSGPGVLRGGLIYRIRQNRQAVRSARYSRYVMQQQAAASYGSSGSTAYGMAATYGSSGSTSYGAVYGVPAARSVSSCPNCARATQETPVQQVPANTGKVAQPPTSSTQPDAKPTVNVASRQATLDEKFAKLELTTNALQTRVAKNEEKLDLILDQLVQMQEENRMRQTEPSARDVHSEYESPVKQLSYAVWNPEA